MNDDYKRGLITGLAMQPLYVVNQQGGKIKHENFCVIYVVPDGIKCDDTMCVFINKEE